MATQYTSLLGLALPVTGELSGSWGDVVNDSITSLLDSAISGTTSITTDADTTLTTTTGAANQARQAIILWNPASGTTTRNITAPAQSKIYTVINASGGTQSIVFRGAGPTTGVTIVKGESAVVAWNGTDFIKISNAGGSASFTNVTVSGTTTLSGLTASTALALDASKNVVSVTNTGTGNNVLSASPTLTGTISGANASLSGTLGVTGVATLTAQPILSSLTTSQAVFTDGSKGLVSNAITGTGSVVMSASPTLTGTITAAAANFSGAVALGDAAADNITVNGTVTSNLIFTDNTYDIGASGATRPRNLFLAGNATVGGNIVLTGSLDLTNLEVTNIKAKDGTAGMQIADSTGVVSFTANPVMSGGTANGVAYLNGSKVLTTGSALTFDGTNFCLGTASSSGGYRFTQLVPASGTAVSAFRVTNGSDATFDVNLQTSLASIGTGVGDLAFLNVGSEQMRLTSTGLGIGTSSPGQKLTVAGTQRIQKEGAGYEAGMLSFSTLSETGAIYRFGMASGGSFVIGRSDTSATNLTLDSSGNLGIGTTSNFAKLDVIAPSTNFISPQIVLGNSSSPTTGQQLWLGYNTSSNNGYIQSVHNGSAYTSLVINPNGGNLGLGVTPSAWNTIKPIEIARAGSFVGANSTGSTYLGANTRFASGWIYANTGASGLYTVEDNTHFWRSAPSGTAGDTITWTQAMTLGADGNLAIGTTSTSSYRLGVNSGASANTASFQSTDTTAYTPTAFNGNKARLYLQGGNGTGATNGIEFTGGGSNENYFGVVQESGGAGAFVFQGYNGSSYEERMRLDSSGNLGIGTSSPGAKLDVNGGALIQGLTVGRGAGAVATNTAVGASALAANTTGLANAAFSQNALVSNTTGNYNTAVGRNTLYTNTTGSTNTAVGVETLYANTTGASNVGVGYQSLASNTTASNNTAVGYQAGYSNVSGTALTAIGHNVLRVSTGGANTGVGYTALYSTTTGIGNTAVGGGDAVTYNAALFSNTTGSNNTAVGNGASESNTTASENTAVGYRTASGTTTGGLNTSLGAYALYRNQTGTSNVAIGRSAVGGNAGSAYSSSDNTGVGTAALALNQTGSYNVAVGAGSLASNTTASNNTAVGYQAGYSNTTGYGNTILGHSAGYSLTTGYGNVLIGSQVAAVTNGTGYALSTGTLNTLVGAGAGAEITTGSKNTLLGAYNGNQYGLDIRTLSNYLVLSDGDGNPRIYHNGTTVVIPSLPTSSVGLPSGGLYVVAGALMVA